MESFWETLARIYGPHCHVILAFPTISRLSEVIERAPVEPVSMDMNARSIRALWAQCRYLHRHRVRLVYGSDWRTWDWRYLLYRLSGVRTIVVHDHTPGVRAIQVGPRRWLKRLLNRAPWLAADGAIGATEYVRRRLIAVACVPERKCFSAPNGLPDWPLAAAAERQELRAKLQIPDDRTVLVMTGRANRYKGVDFAIRCMAQLRSEGYVRTHFLFVGDGPDLEHFRANAIELGVADACTFIGRREDVAQLLHAGDFAIHPSRGEVGYSLSILEYMRAGLAVVVHDNPSVCAATVHGETGLIYRDGDERAAADCLRRLMDDPPGMRRMGAAAREAARKNYSLEACHKALLTAFERLDPEWPDRSSNAQAGSTGPT